MVATVLCGADRTGPLFSEISLSVCTMYRYSLGKSYLNSVHSVISVISLQTRGHTLPSFARAARARARRATWT